MGASSQEPVTQRVQRQRGEIYGVGQTMFSPRVITLVVGVSSLLGEQYAAAVDVGLLEAAAFEVLYACLGVRYNLRSQA